MSTHDAQMHGHDAHPAPGEDVARDPVCGMTVKRDGARYRHLHAGREYVFCSAGCLAKFRDDPIRYLGPSPPHPATAPSAAWRLSLWRQPPKLDRARSCVT